MQRQGVAIEPDEDKVLNVDHACQASTCGMGWQLEAAGRFRIGDLCIPSPGQGEGGGEGRNAQTQDGVVSGLYSGVSTLSPTLSLPGRGVWMRAHRQRW